MKIELRAWDQLNDLKKLIAAHDGVTSQSTATTAKIVLEFSRGDAPSDYASVSWKFPENIVVFEIPD